MRALLSFLTTTLFACTIIVDYPACYFIKDFKRVGNRVLILLERNEFYGSCPTVKKGIPLDVSENDVIEVYLGGRLYKVYRGSELCS